MQRLFQPVTGYPNHLTVVSSAAMERRRHQPEIIVRGVRNLTDARYFAAMGVHWMGFPLGVTGIPVDQISAIMDWVEVPKYFVEISATQHQDVPDIREMLQLDAVMTPELHGPGIVEYLQIDLAALLLVRENWQNVQDMLCLDLTSELQAQELLIDQETLKMALNQICASRPVWLALQWKPSTMMEMLRNFSLSGLVISAGDEEVIGVKSYEDLDRFFEAVEGI